MLGTAAIALYAYWTLGLWHWLGFMLPAVGLLLLRWGMLIAIAPCYANSSGFFWLSPFADLLAVLRILLSSLQKPKQWRGRSYLS